jgi:hypothetical protein
MTATYEEATQATLEAIKKAATTGIDTTTGIVSYDLLDIVRLIPVVTPFREKVARRASTDGAKFALWRAIMNVNNQQPRPVPGFDTAGSKIKISEQDFQASYKPVALGTTVTQDSLDIAKGYDDVYAEATMQLLNQVLIGEEKELFGGQSFALAQPGTVTVVNSTTGGSVAASTTIQLGVAARTASGYFYGGNSRGKASATTTTTGSTSKLTASIAAVRGAVAYDWFFSPDSGTTWWYAATTTVASYAFTATLGSNNALSVLPDLYGTVPTFNGAADNGSGNTSEFDGFLASLTADYNSTGQWVTSGSATTNPSVWNDNAGAALALSGGSVDAIETLFLNLWNQVKCSPTALMMNAQQAQNIANLILGSNSAVTYLQTDASGRINVTAGGRVGQIVNTPAGGVTVPIEVHVALPPGTIIARTDRVPWPQANIASTLEVRTLRDMTSFEYGVTSAGGGPRRDFEVRSMEAFINRAPVSMGVLTNCV